MESEDRNLLTSLFNAAIAAADADQAIRPFIPNRPKGKTVVIGAGKGVAQLAAAFSRQWDGPLEGVVVTRYGYGAPSNRIRVIEAGHPVPDEAGIIATRELFSAVRGLTEDDLVVALICGGGSALLPFPPSGFFLRDEIELNKALLASGAPISVMNAIRKQFSSVKGGRLAAAAAPAKIVTLVVSDVPGDSPSQVASGPTVPDSATRNEARNLAASWRIKLPPRVKEWLDGDFGMAPSPDEEIFGKNETHIIASARLSLEAAAKAAEAKGISAHILSDAMEGEARDVGYVHAAMAREVATRQRPFKRPSVILSGGETTVTLKGQGKGGRNSEFLLAFALAAEGIACAALAADTDGIDGSEDNAGAFADGTTAGRLRDKGMDGGAILNANDSWSAFDALGDLFVPGPTGTNVNDFRAILLK